MKDAITQQAFVVPIAADYPLCMLAHGGDFGLLLLPVEEHSAFIAAYDKHSMRPGPLSE